MEIIQLTDNSKLRKALETEVLHQFESWMQLAQETQVPPPELYRDELAPLIDHTALRPETDGLTVHRLCREAREQGFASVCVNSSWVPLCVKETAGTDVLVCSVAGFPLGCESTHAKVEEAREAVRAGAREIDMVQHVGKLRSGDHAYVYADIRAVVEAVKGENPEARVKVILETCLLDEREIIACCILCREAQADFVKTSTGFNSDGAHAEHVRLMRHVVGDKLGVKAAGGIRNYATACEMVGAGASRLGASSSLGILKEAP